MTDEEIEKLAKMIEKHKPEFHIDPKKQYDSHKRIDKLLDSYEEATGVFKKFFIGALILGMFAIVAVGLNWNK